MTRHEFIKLPIRFLDDPDEYQVKRGDPFFVDFWKYNQSWPAINDRCYLEIGHDGHYRYIVHPRSAQIRQKQLATSEGGK